MARIFRSEALRQDLIDIWLYVARDHVGAADALLDSFEDTIDLLGTTPHIGKPEHDLLPDLRSMSVGNYLLYYRVTGGTVELLRVIHGARHFHLNMLR